MESKKANFLIVRNIDEDTKKLLKQVAQNKYGSGNISALVRHLIANEIKDTEQKKQAPDLNAKMQRVQISLPTSCIKEVKRIAESRFTNISFYITTLIYEKLGARQFQTDEVEVLRNSNYALAKIGSNLNQIARAFNTILKLQGTEKLPPVSRDMEKLKKTIEAHTELVLGLLNQGTVIRETRGKGSNAAKGKKNKIQKTK